MSQIKKKFIEDNAVDGLKIRLLNNQTLRARNAANSADVDLLRLSATDVFEILRELSMTGNKITNLADPTNPQDAATMAYVASAVAGISDPKDPVKVATTGVLPAVTYNNGTGGVGATLTANVNGALPSIDGVALSLTDRILVKNQVAGLQNGIYAVTDLGSGGTPFILTRTADADDSPDGEVSYGMFVNVVQGSLNGQQIFYLATPNPITLGTTALIFSKFAEVIIAGTALSKVGATLSVNFGNGIDLSSNALIAKLDSAILSLATQKFNGSGEIVGIRAWKQSYTLSGTDITNQYIDLSKVASQGSLQLIPVGGPPQREGTDYNPNYTGGTSSKTRVAFAGDLATGGNAALVAGDIVEMLYESLDY